MTTQKTELKRQAKSCTHQVEIRFSQISTDAEVDLCHRDVKEAFTEEKLAGLTESLVQEGAQTPLTVFKTAATKLIAETMLAVYTLIGGHRRFHAIQHAIEQNLDVERFYPDMPVQVVEVVQGEGQTDDEFRRDVLLKSVAENEQRAKLTAIERLHIVKRFQDEKVPAPRARSALDLSASQYRRDDLIARHDWLYEAVAAQQIKPTDAAKLIDVAVEKDRVDMFREDFFAWVEAREVDLQTERDEAAKLKKEITGAANTLQKYLTSDLVRHWADCLKQGVPFDGGETFSFGVVLDQRKKTLNIPAVNAKTDNLRSAHVRTLIGELREGARKLVPLMKQLQAAETATDIDDDAVDAELESIERTLREEAAGRPHTETEPTPPPTTDLEADIQRRRDELAAQDDDTSEEALDGDDDINGLLEE